jgi:hypothetical protein
MFRLLTTLIQINIKAGYSIAKKPTRYHLNPAELEEKFIKGGGKGGQKINKSAHCVVLKHVPTDTVVRVCTRSLEYNRHLARDRLERQVEFKLFGENSRTGIKIAKIKRRNERKSRKTRVKYGVKDSTVPPVNITGEKDSTVLPVNEPAVKNKTLLKNEKLMKHLAELMK